MNTLNNHVQLMGHLGAHPEMKTFDSGKRKLSANLATTDRYQSKGEWTTQTQWHRLVAWERTAERMHRYLQKGSRVLITGKLVHRSYQDQAGMTRYISEVQVLHFIVLNKLNDGQDEKASPQVEEADLPF